MEKKNRDPGVPELKKKIQELIDDQGGGYNTDLVADIIENALKLLTDVESRGDVRVIQTALRELRYAFKLFAPHAVTRKVTLFGSARTQPSKPEYRQAIEFARRIADEGWMVITGAGPGIMQAGHEGAGSERSFGANIRLPWEQNANPVIHKDKKLINFKYFFTRKLTFLRHSDAIVLFPGGFGTLDEGYEALTLMQTGKSRLMPLILMDRPGGNYWKTWDKHTREHLLRNQFISRDDLGLFNIVDDVDDAVHIITRFYRNFQSIRYVRDLLVIRMKHAPSDHALDGLNDDFRDIICQGKVARIEPTPEELEDGTDLEFPRIAFEFNKRDYGRLRQMIEVINSF
ncbi:MAG: TIGR00730 family Rossman fold protein [Syntrophaceae bacterium]|nr:TIGR00730 family Rossman fold protein [Syntrophaceae bacterium]